MPNLDNKDLISNRDLILTIFETFPEETIWTTWGYEELLINDIKKRLENPATIVGCAITIETSKVKTLFFTELSFEISTFKPNNLIPNIIDGLREKGVNFTLNPEYERTRGILNFLKTKIFDQFIIHIGLTTRRIDAIRNEPVNTFSVYF